MEDSQDLNDLSLGVSPFFNGSIAEAIVVAKRDTKSLIVYIAEDNEDCQKLEQTTWQDFKVRKALLEQFVTLRLWHRSTDAAHFAAMFPYSGAPTISVISQNGVLLLRLEGYIAPAELVDSLERSIAMKNTAAIVAALASSDNSSAAMPGDSQVNVVSNESDSQKASSLAIINDSNSSCSPAAPAASTNLDDPTNQPEHSASAQMQVQAASAIISAVEDPINQTEHFTAAQMHAQTSAANIRNLDDDNLPEHFASSNEMQVQPDTIMQTTEDNGKRQVHEQIMGAQEQGMGVSCQSAEISNGLETDAGSFDILSDVPLPPNITTSTSSETFPKASFGNGNTSLQPPEQKVAKSKKNAEALLIQVRLTNGKSIRKSFDPKDRLSAVKEFVDENRDDGNTNYSLGMLYPRKVFNQGDMEKSLVELSLDDRVTLVLLKSPSQQTSSVPDSTSTGATTSEVTDSGSGGGLWKIFSYLNPLSYLSGSNSNTNNIEAGSSSWQFEPNPNLRNSLRQGAESLGSSHPNASLHPNAAGEGDASDGKKAAQARKWGSNVHTLHHNDNEEAFKRGNAFWNGNSTQYGGDDSKK